MKTFQKLARKWAGVEDPLSSPRLNSPNDMLPGAIAGASVFMIENGLLLAVYDPWEARPRYVYCKDESELASQLVADGVARRMLRDTTKDSGQTSFGNYPTPTVAKI